MQDEPQADQEVEDDMDGERDSFDSVKKAVEEASKGVSEGTHNEYRRTRDQFIKFVVDNSWVSKDSKSNIVGPNPSSDTPFWIVAWIIDNCDSVDIKGDPKSSSKRRAGYGHAQKLRASMTYWYGKEPTIGTTGWHMRDDNSWAGNASISPVVSQYMSSLRRRKTQAGETPVSARSVTTDIMGKLYRYNHRTEHWTLRKVQPHARGDRQVSGPYTRHLLQAAYTLAFICLLRFDEVLRIQIKHIKHVVINGTECLELTLPFRKTNQFGGIKPFYLHYMDPSEAHLCPVRAVIEWIAAAGIRWEDTDAYLFHDMNQNDQHKPGSSMTSEKFLELFRNNLIDVGVDPITYGTHSFRRGGCQWLSSNKRWPPKRICDWGGWSQEFNTFTIIKYLWSENDDPIEPRDQFLNPNRPPVLKCYLCGRSCRCA